MPSKNSRHLSINSSRHKRVLDILDQWEKQGLNYSDEICKAIRFYQTEKERGAKLDKFIEPTKELINMPRIHQELKDEDIEVLSMTMTRGEMWDLSLIMEKNFRRVLKKCSDATTIYKKPQVG